MPAPTPPSSYDPPPDTPDRTQPQNIFVTQVYNFLNWMGPFGTWIQSCVNYINAAIVWVQGLSDNTQSNSDIAAAAAVSASASAASALQQPGTNATSTSTITPVYGSNSFTLSQTGKNFVVNQFVTVANSNTKYFNGIITAFNSSTGAITVDARDVVGTGSASSWTITASAPSFGERFIGPVQEFVSLGTVSGTVNLDLRAGLKYSFTTGGNVTITVTPPIISTSTTEIWYVAQITKGGSHTIAFPAGSQWSDGTQTPHASGAKTEYLGTKQGTDNWIMSTPRKNIS